MTCSRNLFKHFLNCYQIKINREILQHGFSILFKSNDFFSKKKVIKYSLFRIYFWHLCKILKKKKKIHHDTCIWMFSQDKIMWFKNKNTKIINHNTKFAKQMWKQIFIMRTYANMNMKRTWQGYGVRSCLRLMLNILKETKGPTPIFTPLES
jgi:hypothetical protein